jgi:hypothetical protein
MTKERTSRSRKKAKGRRLAGTAEFAADPERLGRAKVRPKPDPDFVLFWADVEDCTQNVWNHHPEGWRKGMLTVKVRSNYPPEGVPDEDVRAVFAGLERCLDRVLSGASAKEEFSHKSDSGNCFIQVSFVLDTGGVEPQQQRPQQQKEHKDDGLDQLTGPAVDRLIEQTEARLVELSKPMVAPLQRLLKKLKGLSDQGRSREENKDLCSRVNRLASDRQLCLLFKGQVVHLVYHGTDGFRVRNSNKVTLTSGHTFPSLQAGIRPSLSEAFPRR